MRTNVATRIIRRTRNLSLTGIFVALAVGGLMKLKNASSKDEAKKVYPE